ncbi:MAG: serine hydrolase domain-containing protein [Limisphaerales bacterium]
MRRRRFLSAGGAAVLGALALPRAARAAESKPSSDDLIRELESLIPKLMTECVVPGLSIAVVRDGKLLWTRGFGVKESGTKEAVNDGTVFEAASVSKTVFAYAALKLCDRGVLELDAPLTKYLPDRFMDGDARLDRITARQVLSHSSGFQDWRSGAVPLKIHFTPGTQFMYSGEGYFYLQSVMTHLTGRVDPADCANYEADLEVCATDFDAYMKRTLLAPFGMDGSGYEWSESFEKNAARPHDVNGNVIAKGKPRAPDVARYGSAGGLITTARDFAKFLIEIVAPKESDAFRLKKETLREMVRPQIKLPPDQKMDGATSWALGWAVQERPEGNLLVHSGGQSGFRSLAMASVEKRSGFIALTNSDNGGKLINHPKMLELLGRAVTGE